MPGVEPTPRVEDEDEFRSRVRGFLVGHAAPRADAQHAATDVNVAHSKAFQAALFSEGLAGLTWPREYGGQGLPISYQSIFNEEAQNYDLPTRPFSITFGMAVPVILKHGSVEQKHQFVPPAIRGDEIWCQLFSEPSSGSDLASVRSTAIRDGDEWILNGQKVWTSGGHYAQHGLLLARTDPEQPKHRGLSMFLLDMDSKGVEVRPLRQITGRAHFNEVFFEDVRIPGGRIVGESGDGWRLAITDLMNERVTGARSSAEKADRLVPIATQLQLARQRGLLGEEGVRQTLMDLVVRYWVFDLLGVKMRQAVPPGGVPGPDGSMLKLAGANLNKRAATMAYSLAGAGGAAWESEESAAWQAADMLLESRSASIGGGSNQIMRNILGERVLGLATEQRVDRELPFRELPV
jgi:alkylation response protein AidB-like acyl-CoA dehydrogenase